MIICIVLLLIYLVSARLVFINLHQSNNIAKGFELSDSDIRFWSMLPVVNTMLLIITGVVLFLAWRRP